MAERKTSGPPDPRDFETWPKKADGGWEMWAASLSSEDILVAKAEVLRVKSDIRGKLDCARRHAAATGDYADHEWFLRAEGFDRALGRMDQRLAGILAERRAAQKRKNVELYAREKSSFLDHFRDVAKEVLSGRQFREISEEASRRADVVARRPDPWSCC